MSNTRYGSLRPVQECLNQEKDIDYRDIWSRNRIRKGAVSAKTGTATLTVAESCRSSLVTGTGRITLTFPTGANLLAEFPLAAVGQAIFLAPVVNISGSATSVTLAANGTGGTLVNGTSNATLAQGVARQPVIVFTDITTGAYNLYLL